MVQKQVSGHPRDPGDHQQDYYLHEGDRYNPRVCIVGFVLHTLKKNHLNEGLVIAQPLTAVAFSRGQKVGKRTFLLEVTTAEKERFAFLFDDTFLSKAREVVHL